ncbi:FHA domain-containing protein [Paenibacillus albiflavus]|uniref:FHA domain-containing protein n=1 Tax=Paenibacillus albiflavus TaxID=2545760 RepID=A0A4V2WQ15_9BACL|nr:DUF6382 domain-containing protein [Paenibacillus albiflavus]TCZ81012.1 FHA domain-containing protein [Paenibacillus albiflavus]
MSEEIAGLQVRYIDRGGHYMVIDQGISREQLNELQTQMLTASTIPGVLPLRIDEIDLQIQLLYDISTYKMLHYALQIRRLTDKNAVELITRMTDILSNSVNYLLQEGKYVIHDRMIYVGENWGDVSLAYVPIHHAAIPSLQNQFKKLLATLAQYLHNHHEPSEAVKALQRYCDRSAWTLAGFKEEVAGFQPAPDWFYQSNENKKANESKNKQEIQADSSPILTTQTQAPAPEIQPKIEYSQPVPPRSTVDSEDYAKDESVLAKQLVHDHVEQLREESNWKGTWWDEVEEESPKKSLMNINLSQKTAKMIIYVLLAVTVVLGAQTAMEPTDLWLYPSSGMLVLLLISLFVLKDCLLSNKEKTEREQSIPPSRMNTFIPHEPNDLPNHTEPKNLDSYYDQLGNRTTLLSSSHPMATTLLDAKSKAEFAQGIVRVNPAPIEPTLEVSTNGRLEIKRIHQTPYLIGRDETGANLIIQTQGVSRIHAEVSEGLNGYVIRDLDSKNGTTLNEQTLVPYESYLLSDGDVIGIVSSKMIFRK